MKEKSVESRLSFSFGLTAFLKKVLHVVGILTLIWTPVGAQEVSSTIVGRVTDPSAAGIPGAEVEVRNLATQTLRSVQTDPTGNYEAAGLLPGTYKVTVQVQGFKTQIFENVSISRAARIRVDAQMTLGEVTSTVSVEAALNPIETERPRLNQTLSSKQVLDLPYNRTGTLYLARFIPGTYAQSGDFEWTTAGFGNTQINNTFDGVTANNGNAGLVGNNLNSPILDGVQEVSYTTLNQSAEEPFATTYAVITKSGSPEFHGSAYWYLSNNSWNARNFFATTRPTGRNTHRFGGTLGGPIIKDKTFFFLELEGQKRNPILQYNYLVPTEKLRNGDFSGLPTIKNPFTDLPYTNNIIPSGEITPTSRSILDLYYPLPNVPRDANFGFYRLSYTPSGDNAQHYSVRVDHKLTNEQNVFVKVGYQRDNDGVSMPPANLNFGPVNNAFRNKIVSASHIYAISPQLLNEFRFGFTEIPNIVSGGTFSGPEIVNRLGLKGYANPLPDVPSGPIFSISGPSTISPNHVNRRFDKGWTFGESVTLRHSKHTLKAGFRFRGTSLKAEDPRFREVFGNFSFDGTYTGAGMADFLLGIPRTASGFASLNIIDKRVDQYHWYLQDDFQLSSRLTLSLGLRFEWNPEAHDAIGGLLFTFDPNTGKIVVPGQAQLDKIDARLKAVVPVALASEAGFSQNLIEQNNQPWYPRVGLAYRPFGDTSTVVRAGYGLYAADVAALEANIGGPYTIAQTFDNVVTPGGALFRLPQVFPNAGPRAIAPGTFSITGRALQERHRMPPYSQQWNLTLERQLTASTTFRVSYVGTKGTHLPFSHDLNQVPASTQPFNQSLRPFPLYRNILLNEFRGNSIYHGLQTVLSRKFSKGLVFDVAYSWNRDINDAFTFLGGANEDNFNFRRARGNGAFTPRQRFTAQYIWELPFGQGRAFGKGLPSAVNAVLGGWQVSGMFATQTGRWVTPTFSGRDTSNTQRLGGRADVGGDWRLPESQRTLQRWFNTAAFAIPQNGSFGNSGPNTIEGPGRWGHDMGFYKEFPVRGEKQFLRLEATFINVFNHPNFAPPGTNLSSADFGTILSTEGVEGGNGRTMQFAVRYRF